MKRLPVLLSLAAVSSFPLLAQQPAHGPAAGGYRDAGQPVDQRVEDLLGKMTLEEKATMLSGSGWMESAPIPRLGIPAIKMADGPAGIRNWSGSSHDTNGKVQKPFDSTAFPAGIAVGASWVRSLQKNKAK